MEKYEDFAKRNQCWNNYYIYGKGLKDKTNHPMRRNYAIAQKVCKKFYSRYNKNSPIPQVGDIVEFSDGYRVYKHGMIVESHWKGMSKFNLLNVCECGRSHTDGEYFSTSGGAFHTIHASHFALVGWAENDVWTWGCYGSGANQGIYFKLKVRKWIIPYDAPKPLINVRIYGKGTKDWGGSLRNYAVEVKSCYEGNFVQCFESIHAFLAWAEYVGFEYEKVGKLCDRRGLQHLKEITITNPDEIPADAKPLKTVVNFQVLDSWTKKVDDTIYFYVPNLYYWNNGAFGERPKLSQDEEMKLHRKYYTNPLGV